ncbi:MAG: hypothetical protein ACRCY5_02465 [Phocaeicola sp.]
MMKKFFGKIMVAMGCLGIVLAPLIYLNRMNEADDLKKVAPFPPQATLLALGDSHVECTLDPAYFPEMVNRASSSEALLYSYSKLKFYKERNPQISVILLSYNYFLLGEWREDATHGKLRDLMYSRFLPLLRNQPEILSELKDNFLSAPFIVNYFNLPTKKIFNKQLHQTLLNTDNSWSFEGGFRPTFKAGISKADLQETIKYHYGTFKKDDPKAYFGNSQIAILDKMMAYCKEQQIKIVLFNAPTHQAYNKLISEEVRIYADSVAANICGKHGAVYLDMHEYHLPDSMYRDYDHLNSNGAKVITPLVRDTLIKLGIVGKAVPQVEKQLMSDCVSQNSAFENLYKK